MDTDEFDVGEDGMRGDSMDGMGGYGGYGGQQGYDDDDDDDMGGRMGSGNRGGQRTVAVTNQPHDEEVALSSTDSLGNPEEDSPPPRQPNAPIRTQSPQFDEHEESALSSASGSPTGAPASRSMAPKSESAGPADVYNAMDYKHLNVGDDVRELFQYIGRYKAQTIELESKLKPFIPDYIPAVGGIDEFIKVPRPDGKADFLGLKVLDEPAAQQSDPAILTLKLRQHGKEGGGANAEVVGRVEHRDESKAKKIQEWIDSVADIHKTKPAATVEYREKMPDLEKLMEEWPAEMEHFIKSMKKPTGDLDLDLMTYVKLVCGILDIPVYEDPIKSLHVLLTLYLEFKSNPYFGDKLAQGDDGGFGDTQGSASRYMGGGGGDVMTF